jgi:hypothetical protein
MQQIMKTKRKLIMDNPQTNWTQQILYSGMSCRILLQKFTNILEECAASHSASCLLGLFSDSEGGSMFLQNTVNVYQLHFITFQMVLSIRVTTMRTSNLTNCVHSHYLTRYSSCTVLNVRCLPKSGMWVLFDEGGSLCNSNFLKQVTCVP